MYSEKVISKRLEAIERKFGIEPVYHSLSACDEAVTHFNDKLLAHVEEFGEDKAEEIVFDEDEIRWIQNEQRLCAADYMYYATRYAYILVNNKVIHYKPQLSQLILNDIRADLEDRGWAIMQMCLKARQVGITTDSQIAISHRTFFYPNSVALTGSCEKDKSQIMLTKYRLLYDMLPYWLRPDISRDRAGSFMIFGGLNSQLVVQHGRQMSGIGRGNTPTVVHLCLSGKTLVRVEDGRLVPIREVTAGQTTISTDGTRVQIRNVWKSPRSNEMTSNIRVWGTPSTLSCTRDHMILTEAGWKQSKDVTDQDWLIYPIRPITQTKNMLTLTMYGKFKRVGSKHGRPVDFPASFAFGRLCGLYLAEGCLGKNRESTRTVLFSIHCDETERTRDWIKEAFPAESSGRLATRRKNSKSVVLPFGSAGFAMFLKEHFGEKDSKRIPDWAWDCGKEFCEGLAWGYLSGDGHFATRDNGIYATSIRPAILFGLRELLASLGYGWSQISFREEGEYYNRNCQACWILTVAGDTARKYRKSKALTVHPGESGEHHWKVVPQGLALRVSTNSEGWAEDFYDLEVGHDSHTFLTSCGLVHNSELASFEDPENLVEAGLMPAIHEDQSTLFILESTAEGPFGWWYKKWGLSKSGFWEGRAKLCPVFLPWFTRPDIYPTKTWLRQHSIGMENWIPLPVTIKHAERARNNVRASDYLRKRFPENWEMTREQMFFWEISREEAREQGILDVFQREFCADDLEAFTSSGHSVFDVDTISSYNEHTQEPKIVFGFRAADHVIPPRLQIQHTEVDSSRKPIDMGRYQLVPSKWNGWDHTNVEGKLLVFEWPEDNEEYGLGVDTADGIGQDRSVVEVLRKGSITRNDAQVAELASPYINAMDLAPICHAIGLLYQNGQPRQPRMVIEVKGNGELTQLELLKMGWSSFHKWVRYDRKKIDSIKATRLGWFTTSWSRPMLIDKLVKALRDGTIDINSREFVREMATLHRDWDQQDARAEDEAHDDRFMALGFVYFSLHILEFTGRASDISYLRQKREEGNWKYRESSYDEEHELRPDRESGLIVTPYHHPGAMDRSWEEEYV